MLSYFEMFAPNPPPSVGWGGGGRGGVGVFDRFSLQFVKFPALLKFWPLPPPPGPPGVGWVNKLLIFWTVHDISRTFDFLTPVKFLLRPPLGGGSIFFGRNHPQVYPHMRAKFGHDRSGSLAAYTWQTHTQTEFVLYRYRYNPSHSEFITLIYQWNVKDWQGFF